MGCAAGDCRQLALAAFDCLSVRVRIPLPYCAGHWRDPLKLQQNMFIFNPCLSTAALALDKMTLTLTPRV